MDKRFGIIGSCIFLIFMVALLVACAPVATPTPTPTKAPAAATAAPKPAEATPTAAPAAKPTPPPAAAAQPTPGKPPIKIGLLQTLTGSLAIIGKDNQDGWDLYMDKIGRTAAGRKIDMVVEDDEAKADTAMTKLRKLVENDKVNLLAAFHSSAVCNAIAPYIRDTKVVAVITGNCGAAGLTTDPGLRSPYLWRTTQTSLMLGYPLADYAIKSGLKKVVLVASDYAGGIEPADGFAWAFITEGGTIVQEMYPALGATDFGPYFAQINPGADAVVAFAPGTDGLRFATQYTEYGWKAKLPLFDIFGALVTGPNLAQLKDAAVGIIASDTYASDSDTAENKQFLQAFRAKYPGRAVSRDVAAGYSGAQIIEAAIKGVDGNVEVQDKFLAALKKVEIITPKGPFKFDDLQSTVQNIYVKRIDKVGNEYVEKTLATVTNIGQFSKHKPEEVIKFPFTKLKGKWTNINKGQMQEMLKPYVQ